MIRAVLWDNDGVLVDTERLFFEITQAALLEAGVQLTPARWAVAFLGQGRRTRDLALELGLAPDVVDPLLERRNSTFRERLTGDIPVLRGVRETLNGLRGRVRLGLVTGSPRDQLLLMHRHTGLLDFFECIVADGDYELAKPHPDAYLTALTRMGLESAHCLAVEDSPRGVVAAVAAGIRCVLIPHELTDVPSCADRCQVVSCARDVLDLVLADQAAVTGES